MPYVDNVLHTPEEAVAKGKCPECGRDLGISSYQVETMLHWPRGLDPSECSTEGIQRGALLKTYFDNLANPPVLVAEEK